MSADRDTAPVTQVIAIDGPGGVGKSTVSRGVADQLGWDHLDTGAYYRAATVSVLIQQIDPTDEDRVASALADAAFAYEDGAMLLEGIDVSGAIRTEIVTRNVSAVAANRRVRRILVHHQRCWVVGRAGVVAEGRDIGTAVFPEAPLKVFLTARPAIRAARRAGETDPAAVDQVAADLVRRDRFDSSREASPLDVAEDAVVVDTSDLTQEEVIQRVLQLAAERGLS